jgi:hypothetical protein
MGAVQSDHAASRSVRWRTVISTSRSPVSVAVISNTGMKLFGAAWPNLPVHQ